MKRKVISGRNLAILLTAVSFAFAQTPQTHRASLPAGSATVVQAKGEVSIQPPQGAAANALPGLLLNAGTRIETKKGTLLLSLQDGSQVLIEPQSVILLEAPELSGGRYLEQLIGRLFARAQKRLGVTPSFRMGTPTAIISVRGTEFAVTVNKHGKTTVDVYEGLVEVQSAGYFGGPVLVQPSFTTQVEPNHGPEEPRPTPARPGTDDEGDREQNHSAWPALGGGAAGANAAHANYDDSGESSSHATQKKPGESPD